MAVENHKAIQRKLEQMERKIKGEGKVSVLVGYTSEYALYVHENKEMKLKGQKRPKPRKGRYWDPQGRGQSKFLEQPARELRGELSTIISTVFQKTGSLEKALLLAGLRLQRESQRLVPVDTGNFKNSAFTRKE